MTGDPVAIADAVRGRLRSKLDLSRGWVTAAGHSCLDAVYRRGARRDPLPEQAGAEPLAWALAHLRDAGECLGTLNGFPADGASAPVKKVSAAMPQAVTALSQAYGSCQDLATSPPQTDARTKRHADVSRRLDSIIRTLEDLQLECEDLRANFDPSARAQQNNAGRATVPALNRLAQIIDQAKRCCLKAAMALRGVEDEAVLGAADGTSATPYAWPLLPYLDDQEVVLAYLDIPADETRRDATDTLLAQAVLDPGSRQHIHEAVQAVNAERTART
ncbi:hypothetical protein ACIHFD_19135 [Nonomuraea sp. NPDC051941]|uniref:hypothetical protein n=1 Tax=Nonomuraea sp. NPDC051941 TaxID=3364373 RepID=UPI0037CB5578